MSNDPDLGLLGGRQIGNADNYPYQQYDGQREDRLRQVAYFRVQAYWHPIHEDWAELNVVGQVGGRELSLTAPLNPLLVARVRSADHESPALAVVSAVKRILAAPGVKVILSNGEQHSSPVVGVGFNYRVWVTLRAKLGVAFTPRQDGSWKVLTLD